MDILEANQKLTTESYICVEDYGTDGQNRIKYLLDDTNIIKKYCTNKMNVYDDVYCTSVINKLQKYTDGKINACYKPAKKDDSKSIYFNRMYSGTGMQQAPREIRKFIQGMDIIDVDIINSCPSVLLGITNNENINNPYLNDYVQNRQSIIDKYYNGNKDKCKLFIQCCLFSDQAYTNNNFETNLFNEVCEIKKQLKKIKKYSLIYFENKQKKNKNRYGCFLMDIYTIYETNIIWQAMSYYEQMTKRDVMVQQHDGFQAYKDDKFKIHELNKFISKTIGFNIEFCCKSNESEILMNVKEEDNEDDEENEETINYFVPLNILESSLKLTDVIKKDLINKLVYCSERWYMKQRHLWIVVKEPSSMIIETINKYIDHSINQISNKIITEKGDEKKEELRKQIKAYQKLQKQIDSSSTYSMILKHLKTKLLNNKFSEKLDCCPYYICFNNGVYDIKNKKFINNFKKCKNITQTIDYAYQEAKKEDEDFMYDVIKKICNYNEEHMHYYLSILGYCLTGDASLEKSLYFLVGLKGDNGKTLILDALCKDVLGCYASKIERKTFEIGYSKVHKHLATFKTSRIVYVEELSKNNLNVELLKEIGDGKTIENEVMYGTSENINIMGKLICISQHTPSFASDGGMQNRYEQLEFNSSFKDNVENDYDKKIFLKDKFLADKIGTTYKYALLNILLKYSYEYSIDKKLKQKPHEFIEATNETLETNSGFKMWFADNCQIGEDFKIGKEELMTCSKMDFKTLKDELKKMDFIYDKNKMFNKKRGIWEGFKIKISDEDINEDSDEDSDKECLIED